MHLNCWLYKSKCSQKGLAPVYLRITIDGVRVEVATGIAIAPKQWNAKKGIVKGSSNSTEAYNKKLQQLKDKAITIHTKAVSNELPVSAEFIKRNMLEEEVQNVTLLYAIQYHNKLLKEKIGVSNSKATYTKYQTLKGKLSGFIKQEYRRSDLYLKELNHKFLVSFESYLITKGGCGHNTAMKYIQQLKKIIHVAVDHGWLVSSPFSRFKCAFTQRDRDYLSKKEIEAIQNKIFKIQRLEDVRNTLLFACYTGLAYVDISYLTKENLIQKDDGSQWIIINRKKTGTRSPIPLLSQASAILEKYRTVLLNHEDSLLPVISNQKLNAYLKEIGEVCGIKKNLTFHLARHTFATTITLTNGVPIETVSKMLGHTSLKTTQIYAKVVDTKIQEDMKVLAAKLAGK